ncbi:hypothetical protein [Advenella mimigardefordensis]|uniref:Uncharacterized protein n=1 Tax=Advenella mimigardefordensis (strain DSM 17166 / LMG 22922 / DPN7) TaxID=1247726 RepID=W0PES8_ADVMD|nr:hypothetical protein [Advenella mimigardefordensis]AHG65484.1 hypothetical protein MIM_c34230 [Advenella mimigardefordensis DPN7]
MDSAFCTINHRLYDAAEFARLPSASLDEYRRALICNTCGKEAFFRKASSSGRGPCFGARPHGEDCAQATIDAGSWGSGGNQDDEPIINAASRIVIDLPRLEEGHEVVEPSGAEERRKGAGRVFSAEGSVAANATHRSLRSLLRRLNQDPDFQYSNAIITPPGAQENTSVEEFFVRFDLVRNRALHEFKGLWGLITDASYGASGSLWLNTGSKSTVSFVVGSDLVPHFLKFWRIEDVNDFADAQALILATTSMSSGGKVYGTITDLRYVALDLA